MIPKKGNKVYGYKIAAIIPKNRKYNVPNLSYNYALVKLLIPEDANRLSALSSTDLHKCRCDICKVVSIKPISFSGTGNMNKYQTPEYLGRVLKEEVDCRKFRVVTYFVNHTNGVKYIRHKTIVDTNHYESNPYKECGGGINFFLSKEEAIKFLLDHLHQSYSTFYFDE